MGLPALDPSNLPGTHRTRVFVGGSYLPVSREILEVIESQVRSSGFEPILADQQAQTYKHRPPPPANQWLYRFLLFPPYNLPFKSGLFPPNKTPA